jgi:uncharacterized protein
MHMWLTGGEDETRCLYEPAEGPLSDVVLMLAHGAGGHIDHPSIVELARALRSHGIPTVRFNFPYAQKGQRVPDPMPRLTACYAAAAGRVRAGIGPRRLFIGGRSMGGRAASVMAAEGFACDGLALFAYPLHPAGRTDRPRTAHLARIGVPVLCVNGTRDALCRYELMQQVAAELPERWTMRWVEGADHSFHVPRRSGRTDEELLGEIGAWTRAWAERVTALSPGGTGAQPAQGDLRFRSAAAPRQRT